MAPAKLLSFHFSSSTTTIALPFHLHNFPIYCAPSEEKSWTWKNEFCWMKRLLRPLMKKKVENQRNWVNDWIKYMMLFDVCVTFGRWTCAHWNTCHVMSALLHFKWFTMCLALETRVARRKIRSPMCRDWMALFINNERQSFGLRVAISIGMITTKRTPNVLLQYKQLQQPSDYPKWQRTYCCDACAP